MFGDRGPARAGFSRLQSVAMFACSLAAFSGSLKEVPPFVYSPADVTLLTTLSAFGLGLLYALLVGSLRMGRPVTVFALLLGVAAAGSITAVPTDYAFEKFIRLFIVTLPAVLAVVLVVRDHIDAYRFTRMMLVVAVAQSIFINVGGERQYGIGRLTTEDGTTISFGRAAGFVIIATVAWVISSRRLTVTKLLLVAVVAGFHVWTVLAIASKGPLLGLAAGLSAMILLQFRRLSVRSGVRLLSLFVVLGTALRIIWLKIPELSRERFTELGDDGSTDIREQAWDYTWRNLSASPFGHGWGSWDVISPIRIEYPHNIFLEVWFEAGVVGLVALCAALWIPIWNQDRIFMRDRFRGTLFIGVLPYWLVAAMVSGQINDNKILAMLLVAGAASLRPSDEDDDPTTKADRWTSTPVPT